MKTLLPLMTTAAWILATSGASLAQNFDGIYKGTGTVVPSYSCIANSYQTTLTISGNQFTETTTRSGGRYSGSKFDRTGTINKDGLLTQRGNSATGDRRFFWAKVVGGEILGAYGSTGNGDACIVTFNYFRQ